MKKLMLAISAICILFSCNFANVHADEAQPKDKSQAKQENGEVKIPEDKEKFHLYLLMGQSNMVGIGKITEEDKKLHPRIFNLTQNGKWVQAKDPLHGRFGVGLGLTFVKDIADSVDPSISIGLIPCAKSNTPLSHWVKGGDLYNNALDRAKKAMDQGVIKGVLYHQGERDVTNENNAKTHGTRLQKMIRDLRQDLGNEELPFIVGELGHFLKEIGIARRYVIINEGLNLIPTKVKNTGCVSAKDLTNIKRGDPHFNTKSYHELGHRYAKIMLMFLDKKYLTKEAIEKLKNNKRDN